MEKMVRPGDKAKGYLLGVIAAATYGMIPLFALPLYSAGMNAESVLFWRYLFAVGILAVMVKVRGWSFRQTPRVLGSLFLLGLVMAGSSLGLFMSYNYMAAGIASTVLFVYPIIVAVIMAVFYRERLSALTVVCMLMATAGIALLCEGGGESSVNLPGMLLVLGSALCYAVYLVAINRRELKDVPTVVVTFYVLVSGAFVFLAEFAAGVPLVFVPADNPVLWLNIFCLALLPTVVSFVCTTVAIHYIGSTPTAILGSLEPVTAIFFGVVVFGEHPSARDWLGLAVIITAVTLVIAGGRISLPLTRFRKLFAMLKPSRLKIK